MGRVDGVATPARELAEEAGGVRAPAAKDLVDDGYDGVAESERTRVVGDDGGTAARVIAPREGAGPRALEGGPAEDPLVVVLLRGGEGDHGSTCRVMLGNAGGEGGGDFDVGNEVESGVGAVEGY